MATSIDIAERSTPQKPANASAALPPFSLTPRQLAQTFGRTLLLIPHSDDECNLAGLLQYLEDATVLFLTDSAPRDAQYWSRYGSRECYRNIRRREAEVALGELGVNVVFAADLLGEPAAADQELYRHLPALLEAARELIHTLQPKTVLAPAYEGGHPDHDAAAYLAATLSREIGARHWEVPYYHRTRSGKLKRQEFLAHVHAANYITLALSREELARKREIWSRYASQTEVLSAFTVERELYRPAPPYDFSQPPHSGQLNYEAWEWKVRPVELIEAFAALVEPAVISETVSMETILTPMAQSSPRVAACGGC